MALLLALAVNVGVGTMVESFSRTFLVWLDGRLAADVYVNAANDAQATEIKAWLRERPEVEAILPGGRADTQSAARRSRCWACPITPPIGTTGRCWNPGRRMPGQNFAPGDAGLVSEQLARRLKLAIGDRIDVPASGGNWPLEVVGIYADYGNPKGQIAVNFAALTRRFPGSPADANGPARRAAKIPALIAALQEKFGLDDRNVADQATMKAESTRIFNRTFAVTAALNAFTLGVAGIALLTSLLTLSNSRLPQLAPLWAIGITRRRLGGDRTVEDDVGSADHRPARAAAGTIGGVVPARGGECKSLRLAAAVSCLPAAIAVAARRGDGGGTVRRAASGHQIGAHAAGQPDQDFRQ